MLRPSPALDPAALLILDGAPGKGDDSVIAQPHRRGGSEQKEYPPLPQPIPSGGGLPTGREPLSQAMNVQG